MMKIHGMKMRHYWFSVLVFDFALYSFAVILFLVACWAFGMRFITQTSTAAIIVLHVLWGLNLCAFAVFLRAFIKRGTTATIFGYSFIVVISSVAIILELLVFTGGANAPVPYLLVPPFAFEHGYIHLLFRWVRPLL